MPKYKFVFVDPNNPSDVVEKEKDFSAEEAVKYKQETEAMGWRTQSAGLSSPTELSQSSMSMADENEMPPDMSVGQPAKEDIYINPVTNKAVNPYEKDSLGAAWEGVKQGFTLGFNDEISVDDVSKQADRARIQLAEQGSPVAYNVGQWLGQVPLDIAGSSAVKNIGAGLAKLGLKQGLPTVAKAGASLGTNSMANAAASGALTGGLAGMGQAETGQTLEGGAKGALVGAASSMVGDWLGRKFMPKSQTSLLDDQAAAAYKSANPEQIPITAKGQLTSEIRRDFDVMSRDYVRESQRQIARFEELKAKKSKDLTVFEKEELEFLEQTIPDLKSILSRDADIIQRIDQGGGAIGELMKSSGEVQSSLDKRITLNALIDDLVFGDFSSSRDEIIDEAAKALSNSRRIPLEQATQKVKSYLFGGGTDLDIQMLDEQTRKAIESAAKKIKNLPSNIAAPIAAGGGQALQSDRWKLPEPEAPMLSPREYLSNMEEQATREALRAILEERQQEEIKRRNQQPLSRERGRR